VVGWFTLGAALGAALITGIISLLLRQADREAERERREAEREDSRMARLAEEMARTRRKPLSSWLRFEPTFSMPTQRESPSTSIRPLGGRRGAASAPDGSRFATLSEPLPPDSPQKLRGTSPTSWG
jgi:hypothetical protein